MGNEASATNLGSVAPQPPGRTPHKVPRGPLRCPGGEDTPPEASEAPAREAMKRSARVERETRETKVLGDLEIDAHHTVEDTALALGQALREALGDKAGITRFGDAVVPLDETLARAAVDLSGRPYLVHHEPDGMAPLIGTYDTTLTRHFFESLTATAGICLHLSVTGRNPHHLVEAQFKAVARALRAAAAPDPRSAGVPSTKGVL